MAVFEKKVCMLGAPAVGKTSLVRRFVESLFSERYLATVGVKIDRKVIPLGPQTVNLMLWDLQGEERFQWSRMQYLRGASGYLLVADGTRPETLSIARELQANASTRIGPVPFALLLNKADLADQWNVPADAVPALAAEGWVVIETSARSGQGVEEAFVSLAQRLVRPVQDAAKE